MTKRLSHTGKDILDRSALIMSGSLSQQAAKRSQGQAESHVARRINHHYKTISVAGKGMIKEAEPWKLYGSLGKFRTAPA
ncbi:hypothetical protein T01_2190 [Trichinella spiralis]|uniref:Uncharacterized protein n=1 Tax=Trichinella spiralis TaxID=6334 RepID=A0A0V1BU67_TRISP|nr:hypothetical protein T01_2190 [Trichinella spiralis]